jgi:hypothetical protein
MPGDDYRTATRTWLLVFETGEALQTPPVSHALPVVTIAARKISTWTLSALVDSTVDRVVYDLVQFAARHYRGQDFDVLLLGSMNSIVVVLLGGADLHFVVAHVVTPDLVDCV